MLPTNPAANATTTICAITIISTASANYYAAVAAAVFSSSAFSTHAATTASCYPVSCYAASVHCDADDAAANAHDAVLSTTAAGTGTC